MPLPVFPPGDILFFRKKIFMKNMEYDVVIVGGGPAGVSAGIYASRKRLKTLVVAEAVGGSSAVSASIENWIGIETVPGWELAQSFEKHLRAQEGIAVETGERVAKIEAVPGGFEVVTESGKAYGTRTVIVASGVRHRHLEVPGEEELNGKGVAYCSTCDAPFLRGKRAIVVGGGNSGLEAVEDLLPYATEIVLISNSDILKGDAVTREKILASEKVSVVYSAKTEAILGEGKVEGLRYEDVKTGEKKEVATDGVFVEIGMVPNSEPVEGLVERNGRGEIVVDARTLSASRPGIFAAGDVTDMPYRQNNISAGQGATAALSAYDYLRKLKDDAVA